MTDRRGEFITENHDGTLTECDYFGFFNHAMAQNV